MKRTPWPIRLEVEEKGQVEHQMGKGISKRMVGGAVGLELDLEEERRVRLVGGPIRAESREEGAW